MIAPHLSLFPLTRRLLPVRSALAPRAAFTIAEVLVAVAVLSLIIALVAQIVSSSTLLTTGSRRRLDAEGQARLVLGRVGEDLARMVRRGDVECLFVNVAGNDAMYFYSEAPASFSYGVGTTEKSAVALVGYRIGGTGSDNPYFLERLGKGLKWSGSTSGTSDAVVFLTRDATGTPVAGSRMANAWSTVLGTSPKYQDGTDTSYQLLSEGVIRLEVAFLNKDGAITQDPDGNGDGVTTSLSNVASVIVTIAVLDESTQKTITKAKLAALSTALGDPTAADFAPQPPLLMARKWQIELASPSLATTLGVPPSVISQVRVYQRIFPLGQP